MHENDQNDLQAVHHISQHRMVKFHVAELVEVRSSTCQSKS